jgi:L-serine ammonia-lyase (EC 4.3.1.17)
MGFSTDDMRIRNSFDIAHEKGLKFSFTPNEQETDIHPNTVDICMENRKGPENRPYAANPLEEARSVL